MAGLDGRAAPGDTGWTHPLDIHASDFITIGLLVILEGVLSADNALVLAILVLGLPKHQRRKALRYGIGGAFLFRIIAIVFAAYMIELAVVKLIGGLYLLYLPYKHFFAGHSEERRQIQRANAWWGMSAFWTTVVKVELTDIVFAVDSILVAVAMSPKLWVVITGGILGIIAMRLVIGQLLVLVQRYPALVDGAFVIIAWVGIKLLVEYLHQLGFLHFVIPKWLSLGLIVLIFAGSYLIARRHPAPIHDEDEAAAALLAKDG
jgi:YkoY family integral membrane protein